MNISQASKKTGLYAKKISDYEKVGLLPREFRSEEGYSNYKEADLERLHFICNDSKVGF